MTESGGGTSTDTWDVIVIGGGPPGENAAQYSIQGSDRTAVIVERELVGGECSYWACMPSKALLRPIELAEQARLMPGVSAMVTGEIDVSAVLKRRDGFTHDHDDSSQVQWANDTNIDVVRGHGRLTGERTVEVTASDGTTQTLTARQAVILGTGTTAAVPPIDGLREALPWISRDVTNLHEVPNRVAVIGGGVVASESATWLRGLGAQVTVLERGERLLGNVEPSAAQLVMDHFREHGVDVRTGVSVQRVRRVDAQATGEGHIHGGAVTITVDDAELTVDEVVVAAGRTPASTDLGLDTVGLEPKGFVSTDDHLQVQGVDGQWLYAIGDITGRALLTHMGKYQARICGAVIAARADGRSIDGAEFLASADHGQVPQVTFTSPQVASIGLTEEQAHETAEHRIETVEYGLGNVAGSALQQDGYKGIAKLVIDADDNVIVGATFAGPDVAELLHSATVAVVGRVTLDVLWHAVPSYPTVSEIWLRLLETYRSA
ncbi:MAG: dihydrolipoyl dehydrogenase family protein [Jatrophihabitans sp.]